MRHNSILKKLIISIAAVIVLNILSVIIYWSISASESNNSFNNPFDCGIVFFHSVTKQGNLSNITKERCNLAVKLYNNGTVKNILCVGGASLTKVGSKMMKEYISDHGIPDSVIFFDSLSYSSITNVTEANKIINNKNFKSALLISSPAHILRLKYLSDKYLFNAQIACITFETDYNLLDIYVDCNTEFIKWIYLLLLPNSFTELSKKLLN